MKAADVMTRNVVTVSPESSVREVARLLLAHRISAVPVVDGSGELVGVVSEGDLMRRGEGAGRSRRSWWLEMMSSNEALADAYVRSHADKVGDVMTRKVVTAELGTSLAEIAARLEKNGIKRVPIVMDGKVVGIVSRANLLQAWASVAGDVGQVHGRGDLTIRDDLLGRLQEQNWTGTWPLNVIVHDGVVELWGVVESEAEKTGVRVVAEQTEGVRGVNDHLLVRPLIFAE